jgi:ribonuclease Z
MEITILGTSSMVPTKERNPVCVFLSYKNDGILFDCAEGAQRQMNIAGISRMKVKKILISHWHGDHIAGLIGLLHTMGNKEEKPTLEIFGPKGTKEYMKHLLQSCYFDVKLNLKIVELQPKKVEKFLETDDYELYCAPLEHSVPCVGYNFVEKVRRNVDVAYLKKHKIKEGPHLEKLKQGKDILFEGKKVSVKDATYLVPGKKISYVMDTIYTSNAIKLAKNADLLLCESTYQNKEEDKAEKYKHMTAQDAAKIASQANVKQLIITHFSQRYQEVSVSLEEAKTIFPNTRAAFDLMKVSL